MTNDAWTFNQPVLLKKSRRNSSVLAWTLFGSTVFASGWAAFAPLPETVESKENYNLQAQFKNRVSLQSSRNYFVKEVNVGKGKFAPH